MYPKKQFQCLFFSFQEHLTVVKRTLAKTLVLVQILGRHFPVNVLMVGEETHANYVSNKSVIFRFISSIIHVVH